MDRSDDPLAMRSPSDENEIELTMDAWRASVAVHSPVAAFQRRTVESKDALRWEGGR